MSDLISRQAVLEPPRNVERTLNGKVVSETVDVKSIEALPSAQPERLTDDDFETIRIHLNAYKEKLCNQHRWKEAEEYQRIIDRFMGFASQPTIEPRKGKWIDSTTCSECGWQMIDDVLDSPNMVGFNFCPNCGADMREEGD